MSSSRVPRLLLYSWHVDGLFQSLKDVRTESQMFRRGGAEIQEEIPVRVSSSVRETFLHKFDLSRKHLLRQMHHLRLVPGVLKKYHVVGVERNGPKLFGIQKEILHDENHGHVPVVRPFGERVGEAAIFGTFQHQIVDDHQVVYARIDESVQIWRETFHESNVWNRSFQFVVSILVFSVKPQDPIRRFVDDGFTFENHPFDELGLAASGRTGTNEGKRMKESSVHGDQVHLRPFGKIDR